MPSRAMSIEEWTKLAAVEDCPVGRAKFVVAHGLDVAVFHLADPERFVVARNSCPHAGASLSVGTIEGNTVTCPWHHWTFDLDSGRCACAEHVTLRRFACRVEDGHVWARLPRS